MKAQDLKHHMKNIAGLAGRCFGDNSILYISLQLVADHIEAKEISYSYEFKQDKFFGGNFMDRIHWRMHRFFDSCASGDVANIDIKKLEFDDIMDQVERREYNCKVPHWITKLVKLREKKAENKTPTGPRSFKRGGADQDIRKSKRIPFPHQHDCCKLAENESYRSLFHPGNIRGLEKPKKKTGELICLRCHTMEYCFQDCKYASGHGTLDQEEAQKLGDFVNKARENKKEYLAKRNAKNQEDKDNKEGK